MRPLPGGLQAAVGLAILGPIILMSFIVPAFSAVGPEMSAAPRLLPPSIAHPFGSDQLGRDIFVRAFAAAQLDFGVAIVGVAVPLVIGSVLGAMAALVDNRAIRLVWTLVVDAVNAFPFFVLVLGVVAVVGPGLQGVLLALALTNWARYARITRERAMAVRSTEYVQATYLLGYGWLRRLTRHVLPNVLGEPLAYALSDFAIVIVTVAGLSFLGSGVRPPTPEWGAMMSEGRLFVTTAPWMVVCPGLLLALSAVGISLIADSVTRERSG